MLNGVAMGKDTTKRLLSEFSDRMGLDGEQVSLEELEELMETRAAEEEADSIALAEEHRIAP